MYNENKFLTSTHEFYDMIIVNHKRMHLRSCVLIIPTVTICCNKEIIQLFIMWLTTV